MTRTIALALYVKLAYTLNKIPLCPSFDFAQDRLFYKGGEMNLGRREKGKANSFSLYKREIERDFEGDKARI
jgi:hypothetical protein